MERTRRAFLTTLATATALGVAGCQGSSEQSTTDGSTSATTTAVDPTRTATTTVTTAPTTAAVETVSETTSEATTTAASTTPSTNTATTTATTTSATPSTDTATTASTTTATTTGSDWSKTFGSTGRTDELFHATEAIDGGYLLTGGTTEDNEETTDAWLLKVDESGDKRWETVVDDDGWGWLGNVIVGEDGYVVPGAIDSGNETALRKYDTSGTEQWEQTYSKTSGFTDVDYVLPGVDGGYLLVGRQGQAGGSGVKAYIKRVDDSGSEKWSSTFGSDGYDEFYQGLTVDDGYVLAGTNETDGTSEAYLVKVDDIGSEQWATSYSQGYYTSSLTATDDGYIAGGGGGTNVENPDAWLLKVDEDGTREWDRTYTDGSDFDTVVPTGDDSYYVVGTKDSGVSDDIWLVEVDEEGYFLDDTSFGGDSDDSGASITKTSDGEYLIVGTKRASAADRDGWVAKRSDPLADDGQ